MKQVKFSRQDVFNTVWNHYVVEGRPFAVWPAEEDGYPIATVENAAGDKSPMALVDKKRLNTHVDIAFLTGLQAAHHKAVNFVFDNVENIYRVKDFYSRAYRRTFRKMMKYFLIHFGIEHSLTIPSEVALTPIEIRLAAKNKR
jgi:hypothetical protein